MLKDLVNPVSVRESFVGVDGKSFRLLDISFVRVVAEVSLEEMAGFAGQSQLELKLDKVKFQIPGALKSKSESESWVRWDFPQLLPSHRAHLRSYLSPKRIGESIRKDWEEKGTYHFHGLNECELWFDDQGHTLFTYLDPTDHDSQFLVRQLDIRSQLLVGTMKRKDYIQMSSLENLPVLMPLADPDVYTKLGECRDIITNFRPIGQTEYHLKQRLLKLVNESLYSTSRRVEMNPKPVKPAPVQNTSSSFSEQP